MDKLTDKITASEAVYGFAAWLTTMDTITQMGSACDCAPIAELAKLFAEANELATPRDGWHNNLIHPDGEYSHGNTVLQEVWRQCKVCGEYLMAKP